MSQQTATRGQEDQGEYVEIDVSVHKRYIGKIKVRKGAKVEEVLEKVKEKCKDEGITIEELSEWIVELNGKKINFDNGKIREADNIEVNENSVLFMSQKMVGGS